MHPAPSLPKYPRTLHIEGSRQPAAETADDGSSIPFAELAGKHLVVEEKLDGELRALCFDEAGELQLFDRSGTAVEDGLLRAIAAAEQDLLLERLDDRYVLYGEWLARKHTVFYDALPSYLHEFDLFDRQEQVFLSTERRQELLDGLALVSVPVLHQGQVSSLAELTALVGRSHYKSDGWRQALAAEAQRGGLDLTQVEAETDLSSFGEGLYVKWEEDGIVRGRYKWIRHDFLQTILGSGSHWRSRQPLRNLLAA